MQHKLCFIDSNWN